MFDLVTVTSMAYGGPRFLVVYLQYSQHNLISFVHSSTSLVIDSDSNVNLIGISLVSAVRDFLHEEYFSFP